MLENVVRRIANTQITFGTSGNASERSSESVPSCWITPSGVAWPHIEPSDFVRLAIASGEILSGTLKPSSEWRAHLSIYGAHSWVGGIVHLHSPYATILSTIGSPIRAVHYQMARVADEVPLVPYQTFGSPELAEVLAGAISLRVRAVLAENHGLFVVGETVEEAYHSAEEVEWTAMIQYHAMAVATPRVLTPAQLNSVRNAFGDYGQRPLT